MSLSFSPRIKLHRNERHAVGFVHRMNDADVWMLEGGRRLRFLQKTPAAIGIGSQFTVAAVSTLNS